MTDKTEENGEARPRPHADPVYTAIVLIVLIVALAVIIYVVWDL